MKVMFNTGINYQTQEFKGQKGFKGCSARRITNEILNRLLPKKRNLADIADMLVREAKQNWGITVSPTRAKRVYLALCDTSRGFNLPGRMHRAAKELTKK